MIQEFINFFYRYPKAEFKRLARFGGYLEYKKMLRNRRLMIKQAFLLPAVTSYPDGLNLYFLTGKKYIDQTLWCISSLNKVCKEKFNFILIDDGSFDKVLNNQITKQLPGVTIYSNENTTRLLQRILPEEDFPNLWRKRREYPHIKKLTDIHLFEVSAWKLVLDSDMLFWKDPVEIIEWLKNPLKPIHMVDCTEAYGYSKGLMEKLTDSKIPEKLNVGIIGLNSPSLNWGKIEHWIDALEKNEGKSYYLEQALSAMLIGEAPSVVLDSAKYIVNPESSSIFNQTGTLQHYVDLSKKGYYNFAWKKLI